MAVEIGTANGHVDLLNKLVTFLTTNAELTTAGQNWTVMHSASGAAKQEIVAANDPGVVYFLRGPGLAGQDEIFVNLFTDSSEASDWYNIGIAGATGFNPDAVPLWGNQPSYGGLEYILTWDGELPYWFIANGRRFIVVTRVSTVYQMIYGGFMLPLAPPSEYPYPLMIGGCRIGNTRWSDTSGYHRYFCRPDRTLKLLRPDLTWAEYQDYDYRDNAQRVNNVWPMLDYPDARPSPDGAYALTPLILVSRDSEKGVYGEIDGIRKVSGFGNASENLVPADGANWLVVQDCFRTDQSSYVAVKLA